MADQPHTMSEDASQQATPSGAYSTAGVDIAAGQEVTALMADALRSTYTSAVLSDVGTFGGLFSADALTAMRSPVLVASTDGVGTKTKVAARMNRWDTLGQDLVNHCVNDILVQGARPLFFLDYVAASKLVPAQVAALVAGAAEACRAVGCALIGGETAEMPGVYLAGECDLAGTIVGVVERERLLDGSRIQPGDVLLALPSSGPHTNGYSLARRVLDALDWAEPREDLNGQSIGGALLAVHRSYLSQVEHLWQAGIEIRGLAHITGGGVIDNLPRILPEGTAATVERGTWPIPPIFDLIAREGSVPPDELYHVFNMGLGMLVVVPEDQTERALATLPGDIFRVGVIVSAGSEGGPRVVLC